MRRAVRALLVVPILGLEAGRACAAPYDSSVFANQYVHATGSDVTATAVDLVNSLFRHPRVTGPGVLCRRSHSGWWY
jgi:hypothetical protein